MVVGDEAGDDPGIGRGGGGEGAFLWLIGIIGNILEGGCICLS